MTTTRRTKVSKTTTYFVALRIDLGEGYDHPKDWDWAALLDLPSSGGVDLLAAQEIALLGDKEDEDE
jgi:hypothetical protein